MSVWVWFAIAAGLLVVFRTVERSSPSRTGSARRMGLTVVLTALGLAVVHAVKLRESQDAILHTAAAASAAASRAQAETARKHRRVLRQAEVDARTPIIRKRLLVAAYSGERGMYEGRAAFLEHCAGCHHEDGGGVPDQPASPAIIGLGERDREALRPYLTAEHPLAYAGVLDDEALTQIEAFLWAGLRDALP